MPDKVVAKFTCTAKTQRKSWAGVGQEFVYDYEFQAVAGNSEENKSFFASTPSGEIKIRAVREDLYAPGQEYYVTFEKAE